MEKFTQLRPVFRNLLISLSLVFLSPSVKALSGSSLLDSKSLSSTPESISLVELTLEHSQYLSEAANTSPLSSMGSLGLALEHVTGKTYIKVARARGEFSFNEKRTPYVAVPELYLQSNYNSPFFFNLGRKKRLWSQMDEAWSLGLWQPLARWDYFKPESQGIIGVGLGFGTAKAGLEFVGSPLFVPDQGPQHELVEGRFESNNRWFWRPQAEVEVFDSQTDIRYKLFKPSEAEVLNQVTLAGRLWVGEPEKSIWASASYAYKPVNQLHIAVDPTYQINSQEVEVAVFPEVVKHHLATVEAGVGNTNLNGWISATQEWPEKPDYPDSYLESPLEDSFWAATGIGHTLGFGDYKARWGYMKRWPLNVSPKESLVGSQVQSSYGRFNIDEAASFSWSGSLWQKAQSRLRWRGQYWYSIPEQGSWISTGLDWQTSPEMMWRLEIDILGTNLPEDDTQGLISRYRSNDRILGGFNYVF